MRTDQGYPAVSTVSDEELDEIEAEAPVESLDLEPTPGIDARIETAEQAGDWLQAGKLKVERAKLEGESSQEPQEESDGESIENLMAQIADAEINRDFYASGMAKVRLMTMKAAQNPLSAYGVDVAPSPSSDQDQDLERRIHDAESRGEWAESLRLKVLRAGVTP